jgi:hypothetical protein
MADSIEAICNLGLLVIGVTRGIDSIDDGSEEADVCKAIYEQDRDEVLSAFAWPFATAHVRPAPIDSTTLALGGVPSGWLYAFAMPADALRVRSIFTALGALPEGSSTFVPEYDPLLQEQIILSNYDAPDFLITFRVTDVTKFPPLFVRALAGRMAEDLVLGLKKTPADGQRAHAYYLQALADAKVEALKGQNLGTWTPAHITARW